MNPHWAASPNNRKTEANAALSRGRKAGDDYLRLKRACDVILASLLIVLTAPLCCSCILLVKMTSRGNSLYSQLRLGQNGIPFWIYKIRTMSHDCECTSGPIWASRNDPRVIPVGRILRILHLDELPQLFNVIRGDMSLIGPRPERAAIADDLKLFLSRFETRLNIRPGLSGLAQVQFPADTDLSSVSRKLDSDLLYIDQMGPSLDIRIALATVLYLLRFPISWRQWVLGKYTFQEFRQTHSRHIVRSRGVAWRLKPLPQTDSKNQLPGSRKKRGRSWSRVWQFHTYRMIRHRPPDLDSNIL